MNPLFLYVLLLNIDLGIQKINARSLCSLKAPRKSGKDAKGDYSLFFEVVFFAGFLYPFTPSPKAPTSGALNPYNLCLIRSKTLLAAMKVYQGLWFTPNTRSCFLLL
jgi:hypothetical protein